MKRRIFVSCGQRTDEERALGRRILGTVNSKPAMEGFFAQEVHSAGDLNAEIFGALQRCDGFFAVMHRRGEIVIPGRTSTHRASVWVEQEIAILCYRMFLQRRSVPIRVYMEDGIDLEGVMGTTIVNPVRFRSDTDVLEGLARWLDGAEFKEEPAVARRADLFRRRVASFNEDHWLFLEILVAHAPMRDEAVKVHLVRDDFLAVLGAAGVDQPSAEQRKKEAERGLRGQFIIAEIPDKTTGLHSVTIANQWRELILEHLRDRGTII